MKIHHIHEIAEDRWVTDPIRGLVRERVSTLKPSGMHTMVFDGKTYKVGEDGAFDVPDAVGKFYLGRAGWHAGPGPFPTDESLGDAGNEPVAPRPRRVKASL